MTPRIVFHWAAVASAPLLLAVAANGQSHPPQPLRPIPGVTAADAFPRGCVDCHVRRPQDGLDVRLSTLMKGWNQQVGPRLLAKATRAGATPVGRHPEVAAALADIPSGCLDCHGDGRDGAPRFARLMHAIHLTGGEENHFLTLFQGECTHCHKLDPTTAGWTVPSAPEP